MSPQEGVKVVQMTHQWRRVEPGYYELSGTNLSIMNLDLWVILAGHHNVGSAATMVEAKAKAREIMDAAS